MGVASDEVAVRQMFDELTAGQPDPPLDRNGRIRRRVRRHRLAQVAGTMAVIAAVAAVAIGVGTSAGGVAPVPGNRPAWALPWPDHRNGSVPRQVLDGAVSAWRHDPDGAASTSRVVWYVGQTVASGQVVVVIFEAPGSTGPRLVAGWASAREVMHGQSPSARGTSPWVLYDVAAPSPAADLFIGLNVHGARSLDSNPDNWVVVLAAPQVRSVGWTAPGPSSTTTTSQGVSASGSASIAMASAAEGLVIGDTGQISGRVQVNELLVGGRNVLRHSRYVGVPGSAASQMPWLAAPGAIHGKPGFARAFEFTGQGGTSADLTGISGQLAVRARCDGAGPLRIQFGYGTAHELLGLSPSAARGRLTSLGTIPCDDGVHELVTSVRLASRHNRGVMIVSGGPATVYRADVGTASKR